MAPRATGRPLSEALTAKISIVMESLKSKKYTYDYPHAALTADCVVFGFDGRELHILLIERGVEPFKGSWSLPGGFMNIDETIEECAKRELQEETGIDNIYIEQFHVFSNVKRDPRERVVTVAFLALVRMSDYRLLAGDDAADSMWFELDELPPLAFDHDVIIKQARLKLAEIVQARPVVFNLLDKKFTMTELQRVLEAVNDTTYDRRNFARKMNATNLLRDEGMTPRPVHNRFAKLFSVDLCTNESSEEIISYSSCKRSSKLDNKKGLAPDNPFNP